MVRPRPAPNLLGLRLEALRKKAQGACDAHISKTPETITMIGIDLGTNTFHLVGLDNLCLSEIKLAHTDDEVRQEMA
jgi:hypothetical protein